MIKQLFLNYGCIHNWVLECELHDHAPESTAKVRAVLTAASYTLQLEMCILVDAIDLFVRTTYDLEADTVLTFKVYDKLQALVQHVALVRGGGAAVPNTRAVASRIIDNNFQHALQAAKDQRVAQLIDEQLAKVEPCFVYFEQKMVQLGPSVDVFKAVKVFHPHNIDAMGGNADAVDTLLQAIPLIDAATRAQLILELPAYRVMEIADLTHGRHRRREVVGAQGRRRHDQDLVRDGHPGDVAAALFGGRRAGVFYAQGPDGRPTSRQGAGGLPAGRPHDPLQPTHAAQGRVGQFR